MSPKQRSAPFNPEGVFADQEEQVFSFQFPSSTDIVDIPSKGLYYPEDHPLHMVDTIEIRHMTGKDEDILTNKNYLKKGVHIEKLLKNLIVDPQIKSVYDTMLNGDSNALLVQARITGIDSEYITPVACRKCGKVHEYDFNLLESELYVGGKDKKDDLVEQISHDVFAVTLPTSKLKVHIKLSTTRDSYLIQKKLEKLKELNQEATNYDLMTRSIVGLELPDGTMFNKEKNGLNGFEKSKKVFLQDVPTSELTILKAKMKDIQPDIQLNRNFTCKSCEFSEEIPLPFSVNFLFPKIRSQ